MNKVFGTKECFAPVREDESRVIVSYDYAEEPDGVNATWFEVYFYKKNDGRPSIERIREAIIKDINDRTDDKSEHGYVWEDKPVKLNWENRQNFKAVHDAAAMYPQLVTFPKVFKLSDGEDGNAVYHQFESMEELAQFYLGGLGWIEQCVKEGFIKKDSFDFTPYEQALNNNGV